MDDVELANVIAGISDGPVEVGSVEKELAAAIGATGSMVLLSKYTIDKQKFTHDHITFRHYSLLPEILLHGYAVQSRDRPRHLVLVHYIGWPDGAPYQLVLKGSRLGDKIHVESFHRIGRNEFARLRRKGQKQNLLLRDTKR